MPIKFAKMDSKFSWDDLKFAAAVGRHGSLSGAARALSVSHATAYRRLNDLEERLGVSLFVRTRTGYTPTPAGEEVVRRAERIMQEIHEMETSVLGRDLSPSGTVRVTTTDALMAGLLAPILEAFRERFPDILLEVAVSNQIFDLSRREADIAIRPGANPPEALVGRRVGRLEQAVYGSKIPSDGGEDGWIGSDDGMRYRDLEAWMHNKGHDARCVMKTDSVLAMQAAVRAGTGSCVLPIYLGDADPDLARIGGTIEELATDLWILTHADLRKAARISAFTDFVSEELRRELA